LSTPQVYTNQQEKLIQAKTESRIMPLIENGDIICVVGDHRVNSEEEMVWSDNNSDDGIKGSEEV
jgi:hypothetical protein